MRRVTVRSPAATSVGTSIASAMAPIARNFGIGITLAALAAGGMYFAQLFFAWAGASIDERSEAPFLAKGKHYDLWTRIGVAFHLVTIAASIGAFVCFLLGVWSVIEMVRGLKL